MKARKIIYALLLLAIAFGSAACGRNPLLGKWEAQQPEELMFPLAATAMGKLEFKEDRLVILKEAIKCKYNVDEDRVTVSVGRGTGPGEVFVMEGRNRMIRNIPSIGKVVYKKID